MTASCLTPSFINDFTLAIDSVVRFPTRTACVHVSAEGYTGTQRVHVRVFCCVVQRLSMSEFCRLLRELAIVNRAMRAFRF
eukprot:3390310-Pleurochrysis_carterae.AAC.1